MHLSPLCLPSCSLLLCAFQIFQKPNFHRGMISYAGNGPDSRGIDLWIAFNTQNNNGGPQAPWETPFGIIDEEGMRA